jgi:hypothetical protein
MSMNVRRAILAIIASILPAWSHAATWYLNAPSYNSALQGLINQAANNDTIILRAGSHYITSAIEIPQGKEGLTIQGEDYNVVLRKAADNPGMIIWGRYTKLIRLDMDGGGRGDSCVIIFGRDIQVIDCKLHNAGNAGILIHNFGSPLGCCNQVISSKIYYNYNVGISQSGHCDGLIDNCQVYENGAEGITVDNGSHNNDIQFNWIYKNNIGNRGCGGIGVDEANGNWIKGNNIDFTRYRSNICFNNQTGNTDGNILADNTIQRAAQWGVLCEQNPYYTTNLGNFNNTFFGNSLAPNIHYR